MNHPTIAEIGAALEAWAEPRLAAAYDNTGLQVGDARRRVRSAVIALDLTPAVLREAQERAAELIVSHHPLLFHPLRQLTPDTFTQSLALHLAEERIALYSIHTNLDAAPGGVSHALAKILGLQGVHFLDPVVTAPGGFGAVGALEEPLSLEQFLGRVSECLQATSLRYVGQSDALIQMVAVCGGAGSNLIGKAMAAGADAYVTADVRYHQFFDVLDTNGTPRMAIIDAGHYETEAHTEALLRAWLRERFPSVAWHRTATRTSPVRSFPEVKNPMKPDRVRPG